VEVRAVTAALGRDDELDRVGVHVQRYGVAVCSEEVVGKEGLVELDVTGHGVSSSGGEQTYGTS